MNSRKGGAARSLALLLAAMGPARGVELSFETGAHTAAPGSTLVLPVRMTVAPGETPPAALQFDVTWDGDAPPFEIVSIASDAIRSSHKRLYRGASPRFRHVVAALNQTAMPEGETLLLTLLVMLSRGAGSGAGSLAITRAVAASDSGEPLPVGGSRTAIMIDEGLLAVVLPLEGIRNGASLAGAGTIAPGTLTRLFGPGTDFEPSGDLRVFVDEAPVAVESAGPRYVDLVAPPELVAGRDARIEVRAGQDPIASTAVQVIAASPGLFTIDATGAGPAVAGNASGQPNSPADPAASGTEVQLIGTGFGGDPQALEVLLSGLVASVSGIEADPAGRAGIQRLTVRIPEGAPSDAFAPITVAFKDGPASPPTQVSVR